MIPPPFETHVLARLLDDLHVDPAELAAMSAEWRPLADRLAAMPPDRRPDMLDVASLYMPKGADFLKAVALADRNGPAPASGANGPPRSATLATVRKLMASTDWPWPGWLAGASLNSLAADPGIGKTILAVTLACILWFRRPWPDGQINPFPEKTKTIWVPADHQYPQLMDLATAYGLPDEAIVLNAAENDPTGGLDLDDPDVRDALKERIKTEAPGLTIVDTVGMTTGLNLCRPEDARAYFGPLMSIANETGTPILLLTHLSRDSQALGRRIVGASRVVWKLTHPDPDGQPDRRRLWVDKTYDRKPPALGMTIADSGCTFDPNPPEAPEPRRPGRPSGERDKAKQFIREGLTAQNDQIGNELCDRWEKDHGGSSKTFWRAVDDMSDDGELTTDGGKGTGKQTILHLSDKTPQP